MAQNKRNTISIVVLCLIMLASFNINTQIANADQITEGQAASSDCQSLPEGVNVVDASNDVSKAPVVFSSNTFNLNFPAYCNPVDIYFAILTPDNKLIFTDSTGKLTLDYAPYTAGSKSAVNTSFSVADSALATEIAGKCVLYWLIAPANGGNILKSIESGSYELGFYQIDGIKPAGPGPEIVQLIPTNTDSISAAWLPPSIPSGSDLANSGITSDSAFVYQVHVGTADKFTPSASTLKKEVSGDLQADISGLSVGTTYYVLIVAKAQNGEILAGKEYWDVKTLEKLPEFNPDVPLVNTENAGLGIAAVSDDEYTFQKSENQKLPEAGSIIVGADDENGYLRKVQSVTDNGSKIVMQTTQGILSEAVTSGRISNTVRMFSPDSSDDVNKTRLSVQKGYKFTRSKADDDSPVTRMEWKDRLLTVEEEISPDFVPSNRKGYRSVALLTREASESLTLEAKLSFEPNMRTDVDWHTENFMPVIDGGEVIALGTFRADMDVHYKFESSDSWGTADEPKEKELWKRKWTSVYMAGGVPVYQQITLTLTAQFWATASSKIDATAHAFAETVIEAGVKYNQGSRQWEPVIKTGFNDGLTAELHAEGSVEGDVRLIPDLKVEFYEVLGANLIPEFYNHGLVKYNADASLDGPDISQFKNFDYYFGVDCNMNLTLWPIFDDEDPLYSAQLYTKTWDIFNLPKIEITSSKNEDTYHLQANITDGTNNQFKNDSIKWEVYDPDGDRTSLNDGLNDGSTTADFKPEKAGKHIIILSGYGKLGEWFKDKFARQYATLTLDDCPTNSLGMNFVRIEPGTFMMGDDDDQHLETITEPFCIQTTEVTQGQWTAVMGSNPSSYTDCGDNCPVEHVSWYDAQEFIAKLNEKGEGTYSLPTEAQWEYAARAGSTTDFANGNMTGDGGFGYDANLDAMGWYIWNSGRTTHPVAQKSPNAWGLYDMHGNVNEWCNDIVYIDYTTLVGRYMVVRGGSYRDDAINCRSFRQEYGYWYEAPSTREYVIIGFRLVRLAE